MVNKLNILARNLRKNQTPQEKIMWNILRNHQFYNLEFKRQYSIGSINVPSPWGRVRVGE